MVAALKVLWRLNTLPTIFRLSAAATLVSLHHSIKAKLWPRIPNRHSFSALLHIYTEATSTYKIIDQTQRPDRQTKHTLTTRSRNKYLPQSCIVFPQAEFGSTIYIFKPLTIFYSSPLGFEASEPSNFLLLSHITKTSYSTISSTETQTLPTHRVFPPILIHSKQFSSRIFDTYPLKTK